MIRNRSLPDTMRVGLELMDTTPPPPTDDAPTAPPPPPPRGATLGGPMMPPVSDPPGVVIAPFMAPVALVGLAMVGFAFHRLLLSWEEGGAGGEISVFPFVEKGAGNMF